jgi:prepilin-type N-terminal cleavage/methylation domain-containing protein/prepilin-type processing-associated H-X9-DG protein
MSRQKDGFDGAGIKISNRERGWFREAFTLVELLVVISIIAILLAVLIPSMNRAKKQARAVIDISNLKQWGLLYSISCEDNGGYFFSGQVNGSYLGGADGADYGRYWRAAMKPYAKDGKMWLCPETVKPQFVGDMPAKGALADVAWKYKGDNGDDIGSYGINGWVLNPTPTADKSGGTDETGGVFGRKSVNDFWRTCRNKGASNIPVFGDMWFTDAWPRDTDPPALKANCPGDRETYQQNPPNEMQRVCVDRHSGYVNIVFMDWSARKVGLKELWTLKWHKSYNVGGRYTIAGHFKSENWPQWMQKYKDY